MPLNPGLTVTIFVIPLFLLSSGCYAEKMKKDPQQENIVAQAIEKLSEQLGIPNENIHVLNTKAVTWRNSSLGCPKPDRMYLQALTPGYQIKLEANGKHYWAHTGNKTVIICDESSAEQPLPNENQI